MPDSPDWDNQHSNVEHKVDHATRDKVGGDVNACPVDCWMPDLLTRYALKSKRDDDDGIEYTVCDDEDLDRPPDKPASAFAKYAL